jgi:hypothetical protein
MFVRIVSGAAVLILSIVPVFGQSATAEFNGSVVDQSGAVLPGAAVTLIEESTGLVRTAVSSDTGRFVLPAVQPGVYTVRAELSGFQTQSRTGVRILVGQAITLTLTMPIGSLTDQVTVTGAAPLIEVTQTTLGSSLTTEDIENLPTQGREMLSLMQMIPGLTPQLDAGPPASSSMPSPRAGRMCFVAAGTTTARTTASTPPTISRSWKAGKNRRAATTSSGRASAGRSSGTRRSSSSTPSDSGSRTRST